MIEEIESKLSCILNNKSESEYNEFINNNKLLKIYDELSLYNYEEIINEETLLKVINILDNELVTNFN